MTTTLSNCEILLSRQLGDYWASTSTSAGASGGTTIVDTALQAKANDWIDTNKDMYDQITEGTYDGEERKISSLASGTLTVLAHTGQIASGIDYRVHRLFTASEKRTALVAAAKNIFPACFQEVWNESIVSGNWLNDGSIERWTTTTNPTVWVDTTVTATQTSTSPYYVHGTYSCKLDTAAGTLAQSITAFDDLKRLAGKSVTFTAQGWCNTANALRLSINDGVTQTYSDYHTGDSAWTQQNPMDDALWVQQFIDYNPTQITFTVHHSSASATSYVDDLRAISSEQPRLYIGHLGLAQNRPHRVEVEPYYYAIEEPWYPIRDTKIDTGGYLYLPVSVLKDRRLRIRGTGYLDFLASGVASTLWTATIALDAPQTEILVAAAALYLYTQMSMPNFSMGKAEEYQKVSAYWEAELAKRSAKFGMIPPPIVANWGDR